MINGAVRVEPARLYRRGRWLREPIQVSRVEKKRKEKMKNSTRRDDQENIDR